jgi:hypothetical protein
MVLLSIGLFLFSSVVRPTSKITVKLSDPRRLRQHLARFHTAWAHKRKDCPNRLVSY